MKVPARLLAFVLTLCHAQVLSGFAQPSEVSLDEKSYSAGNMLRHDSSRDQSTFRVDRREYSGDFSDRDEHPMKNDTNHDYPDRDDCDDIDDRDDKDDEDDHCHPCPPIKPCPPCPGPPSPKVHNHTLYPPQINDRPVIGILSLPTEYESFPVNGSSYIAASYVQWAESGGARVVPIPVTANISEISGLVSSLNGILFTGGAAPFFTDDGSFSNYTSVGCFIFELVKQINDEGTYYPLWATCLGFELIHVCAYPDPAVLSNFNGEPAYANKIQFTSEAPNATLFDTVQGEMVRKVQSTQSIQLFSHSFGVSPATYEEIPDLRDFYKVLAIGHDHNDTAYVALIEGRDYPIYGNQYHPEKNLFEWYTKYPIPHNSTAVAMSSYYARYFVAEARRNDFSFGSEAALKPYLIYNYEPYFLDTHLLQIYLFD
mmetsp:Transcript_3556/g.7625  ORF Transcript_3556/g.7625 Transcript_3556/m.7625 type:complete len:428 (+) Transcript_3556:88-1371(+)